MNKTGLTPTTGEVANLLIARLRQVGEVAEKGGMKGMVAGAVFATNAIKASLSLPHSGPIYGRGRNPASLPGEPPALQSGALRASYRWWPAGSKSLFIGSDDPKAPYLEYGTGRMAPRPHFRVGITKALPQVIAFMRREAEQAEREAIGRMKS